MFTAFNQFGQSCIQEIKELIGPETLQELQRLRAKIREEIRLLEEEARPMLHKLRLGCEQLDQNLDAICSNIIGEIEDGYDRLKEIFRSNLRSNKHRP